MDFSASQCSSGCESGWTRYLDQSSLSEYQFHRDGGMDEYRGKGEKLEEKEEDLSLVSDASSGPSHYHEDDEESIHDDGFPLYSSTASEVARKNKKKKKAKAQESGRHRQRSNLDDTASSPALNFPKVTTHFGNEDSMKNLWNFSQGNFSATQFEGKSAFQENFTFLKSFAEEPASEEQGGFHGRNWK